MTEEFVRAQTLEEIISERIQQLMYLFENYEHPEAKAHIEQVIEEVSLLFKSIKPLYDELERIRGEMKTMVKNSFQVSAKISAQMENDLLKKVRTNKDDYEIEQGYYADLIEAVIDISDGYQLVPRSNPIYGVIIDGDKEMKFRRRSNKIPQIIKDEPTELEQVQQKIKELENKLK